MMRVGVVTESAAAAASASASASIQTVSVVADAKNCSSALQDKKKKRRSRRNKQNSSVQVGGPGTGVNVEKACFSGRDEETDDFGGSQDSVSSEFDGINGANVEKPESSHQGHRGRRNVGGNEVSFNLLPSMSRNEVSFNLLPSMNMNGQRANYEQGNLENQQIFLADTNRRGCLKTFPEPMLCHGSAYSHVNGNGFVPQPPSCFAYRKYFAPHWTADAIKEGLEKGDVFRAVFHVNAHNRLEAYCRIDGVQTDVLVNGLAAQNRAVEGDIVALIVDPPSLWTKTKGITEKCENATSSNDGPSHPEALDATSKNLKAKMVVGGDCDYSVAKNGLNHQRNGFSHKYDYCNGGVVYEEQARSSDSFHVNGLSSLQSVPSDPSKVGFFATRGNEVARTVEELSAFVGAFPYKRPTGRVVGVIEESHRRGSVVGFLGVKQWINDSSPVSPKDLKKNKGSSQEFVTLTPTDPKFSNLMVPFKSLPECIKKRLEAGDATVGTDLVAAQIVEWVEGSSHPEARVIQCFGRGGEIESQIAAIIFQNAIDSSEFSQETLSCLPHIPWEIPPEVRDSRRDLRNICVFTIDPATASDLDDAVSVERLPNNILRVGIHVADVSYFVRPDTALDADAQLRSTSVYMMHSKFPMLPPLLSENLGSLNPGVERLAFSMFWDINPAGEVLNRWIGRTIIQSCCKLSYEHAQNIIDGLVDPQSCTVTVSNWPVLYGCFAWSDVFNSVKILHDISKTLKEKRFNGGALSLESPKVVFLFNEDGTPYNCEMSEHKESNFLIEELMLLANRTAAEVITRAYPSSALLRKHPEPNLRKLKEFVAFCGKNDLEMDISSSGQLHNSLEHIRSKLKNDMVLFDILMYYATKSMQVAAYFCSGESKDMESDWGHYALAIPLYTHFTSPLRRYPDIVVHRTLAAAIEAEEIYIKYKRSTQPPDEKEAIRCFTGLCYANNSVKSPEAQEALATAAMKYKVPHARILGSVAAHCNERKMASRHVRDAINKVYLWAMLKKKEILCMEARVLGLGPRFMSIYIHKLAIERRISYDEVESLRVEWLEATSTLILNRSTKKHMNRRGSSGKSRTLDDVAHVVSPCGENVSFDEHPEIQTEQERLDLGNSQGTSVEPAVFPLTLCLLSNVPVVVQASGGDDGPVDIVAKLYLSSYYSLK